MNAIPSMLTLPHGCINATSLRSLANALDRLAAFHVDRGGPAPDAPCLTEVHVEGRGVIAKISSGTRNFKLLLVHGAWEFR